MNPQVVGIVGLGYTGLPLVVAAVAAGHRVVGYDTDKGRVDQLLDGESYIEDVSSAEVSSAVRMGFVPSSRPEILDDADVLVICVPTPLDSNNVPDLDPITAAAFEVGHALDRGNLVILQSTTYPGTTSEVVAPLLEEASGLRVGADFLLAYSPERIDPGNEAWNMRNTPKVVGAIDEPSLEAALSFLATICDQVIPVDSCEVAEAAKLLENTYRHVNIALANEFGMLCSSLGLDALAVIQAAATKPFGFQPFYPGPGVGGHCIPVDPHYLAFRARQEGFAWRLVRVAEDINSHMPEHVVRRAIECLNDRGLAIRGARILLVGVAYKAGVADLRGSPAYGIAERLLELGADLRFADPHVEDFIGLERADDLRKAALEADLMVIVTAHTDLPISEMAEVAPLVLDTRGVLPTSAQVTRL